MTLTSLMGIDDLLGMKSDKSLMLPFHLYMCIREYSLVVESL